MASQHRLICLVAAACIAGCGDQAVKIRPTEVLERPAPVVLDIPDAWIAPLELPPFPDRPVKNGDLNEYRAACELVIEAANADRRSIRILQGMRGN